jgi:hypothetical protein
MMERILEAWLDQIAAEQLAVSSQEALAAELSGWLALLGPASEGDAPAKHELLKLIALHARSLGYEEKPASATVLRIALLQDAHLEAHGQIPPKTREIIRWMIRVAADAHALGQAERLSAKHQREIRDFSPIVRLDDQTVLAFMLGPMSPELIDAILGRLLRECASCSAKVAVLDVFGAAAADDRFHRTIAELLESEPGKKLTLVLAGLRDADPTKAALQKLGVDLSRLRFVEHVNQFLAR